MAETDGIPPKMVDDDHYAAPEHGWTCFHCGETFTHHIPARRHFGADIAAEPACRIKGENEHGLVIALRVAEAELDRYRDEDTDLHRHIARMASEHGQALRQEEEKGYARGLRDQRKRDIAIAGRVKQGLRNGGARNACDEIARAIADPNVDG